MGIELNNSKRNLGWPFWALLLVISIGAAVQTVLMAKYSALSWTFQQPTYWSAVCEVVVCWALLVCGQYAFWKKPAIAKAVVLTVIVCFCYAHQYLVAAVVGCLYICFIFLLGGSICRWCGIEQILGSWQTHITMGVAGVLLIVAAASGLKVGTPEKLRIILPVIFVILLVLNRKTLKAKAAAITKQESNAAKKSLSEIMLLSGIIAFVLVQVGRANIALDYDSTWYGLRSEYMLAPETGIYDPMPFLACVHTYAKGIETLTLPLSGLGSFGMIYSVNIAFGIGIIKTAYDVCRLRCEKRTSLLAALCTAAIPGIMNMTVTAKSDILTAFLQVTALYFLLRAAEDKRMEYCIFCISACVLSYAFKSSSAIFSTTLLLICVIHIIHRKPRFADGGKRVFWLAGLSLGALSVIWLRTFLMTGCPFTFILPNIWRALGLEIKYPYEFTSVGMNSVSSLLNGELLASRLRRVFDILLFPVTNETIKVLIAWAGPVFALLWVALLITLLLRIKSVWREICSGSIEGILYIAYFLLSGLTLGCVLLLSAPDGNYFELLYAVTVIASFLEFRQGDTVKIYLLVLPSIVSGMLFTAASSPGWALGFTQIDLTKGGYYRSAAWVEQYMNYNSLDIVFQQLKREEKPRVEIFSDKMQYTVFIPATADLWQVHRNYGYGTTASPEAYSEYLQFAEMDYLLLDRDYMDTDAHATDVISQLADDGWLDMVLTSENWALVRVDNSASSSGTEITNFLNNSGVTVQQGLYDDGWAAEQVDFQIRTNTTRSLIVEGVCPWQDIDGAYIRVLIDGEVKAEHYLTGNDICLEIPIEAGEHTVTLISSFARPADAPDIRTDLAFIMERFALSKQ